MVGPLALVAALPDLGLPIQALDLIDGDSEDIADDVVAVLEFAIS
jgi:hypothetical protein